MTESEAKEVLNNIWDFATAEDEDKGDVLEDAVDVAITALSEIQQYRVIGTVSEFRELKEKATPKKPIPVDSGVYDYDFDFVCPNCGENVDDIYNYCECGQHLDWSEGKEC